MKIWAKTKEFREGKFLVVRRDGTVPHWPHFVLGARDAAAQTALRAYADKAAELGYDPEYVDSVRELANVDFPEYLKAHGCGDPEAPPHRKDHPDVIRAMRGEAVTFYVRPDKRNDSKRSPPPPMTVTPQDIEKAKVLANVATYFARVDEIASALASERAPLEAECERLREALKEIDRELPSDSKHPDGEPWVNQCIRIARSIALAALALARPATEKE